MGRERLAAATVAMGVVLLATGCAFMDRDNRRLLSAMDEGLKGTFATRTPMGQVAVAPVVMPLALVAFTADTLLVHPAWTVPDAADTTYDVLWRDPRGSYYRQVILVPPKLAATPLVFLSVWTYGSFFDDDWPWFWARW